MSRRLQTAHTGTNMDVVAAVLISLLVQSMISLLAAGVPVLAPAIAAEHGWNANVIALYPAIVYFTAILMSFQIPPVLVRIGGMGLSLACVAVSAIGMVLLPLPYAAAAVLTAIAMGLATAGMNPASSQVLGPRTTVRTAGLVMSIKQTGVPLGGVAAGALVPFLVRVSGWRVTALELAAIGAAMAMVFAPTVPWLNGGAAAAKPIAFRPLDPVKHLCAMQGMSALLLASIAFNGMQLCLRSFFTIYLVDNQRLSLLSAGIAFSVSQVAGIIGQVVWAVLSDRLLSVWAVMAIIGALMSGAALCTASMMPHWPLGAVFAVATVYGVSAAGYLPVLLGEVAKRSPPDQVGALTSGAQLFPLCGAIVGPLTFGGMAALMGMPAAFVLAAMSTLAGTALLAAPHRLFAILFRERGTA
jgi:MFS family permease